jgi:outer membrane protein assembly factor BamA
VLDGFTDLLTRELQHFLRSKDIAGTVMFRPQGTLSTGIERYTFRVADPAPKLCSLAFPGSSVISEADLKAALVMPRDPDHSVTFLRSACQGTLTYRYRQLGHWRVRFARPQATYVQDANCSGAAVTIAVDEGAAYTVERNEWVGSTVFAPAQLDTMVPWRPGALAGIGALEEGERQIRHAYGTRGYLMQRLSYETRLDDTRKSLLLAFSLTEGPQFKMGEVRFPGLDAAGTATLTKEWRLKPGEVYDASYPDTFAEKVIRPRLRAGAKPPTFRLGVDPNTLMVDVDVDFSASRP